MVSFSIIPNNPHWYFSDIKNEKEVKLHSSSELADLGQSILLISLGCAMLFILAWLLWLYNSNHGNANSNKQQNEDGDKNKEPASLAAANEIEATLYDWEKENRDDFPLLREEEYVKLDIPNKAPSEITPEEELYFQYAANASLGSSFSVENSLKNLYKNQKSAGTVWVDHAHSTCSSAFKLCYFLYRSLINPWHFY